jgi:hypothetical protein
VPSEPTLQAQPEIVTPVHLMRIECDLLRSTEWLPRDRRPVLVVVSTSVGMSVVADEAVPPDLATSLAHEVERTEPPGDLSQPPPRLDRWRQLLQDALGETTLGSGSGPTYLIDTGVTFPASVPLVRSDAADLQSLANANPGNWEPAEWQALLAGQLGPWVMAVHNQQLISVCHTPASNDCAAEAGTWTDPAFRGQGHAAATTAEWATLVRPTRRWLFYSTSRHNTSSQRVAVRLGLRLLGWRWQLTTLSGQASSR